MKPFDVKIEFDASMLLAQMGALQDTMDFGAPAWQRELGLRALNALAEVQAGADAAREALGIPPMKPPLALQVEVQGRL